MELFILLLLVCLAISLVALGVFIYKVLGVVVDIFGVNK